MATVDNNDTVSYQINELRPREDNIDESYVLIGAARNVDNELYVVRSVVNRYTHKLVSVDALYAVNAKKEPAALLPLLTENPAVGTDSTISIAKLLDYVNTKSDFATIEKEFTRLVKAYESEKSFSMVLLGVKYSFWHSKKLCCTEHNETNPICQRAECPCNSCLLEKEKG